MLGEAFWVAVLLEEDLEEDQAVGRAADPGDDPAEDRGATCEVPAPSCLQAWWEVS